MKDPTTTTDKSTTMLVAQPKCLSTESYSLLLLVVSSFFYSGMACFVQLATRTGIPSTELVFMRGVFQGALVTAAMFFYNDPDHVQLIRRPFGSSPLVQKVVIARGAVGGLGFLFYYYTMSVLPIGDATTLLSLNPVITVLAASVFLKEAIHASHVFAAAACVAGSVLIAHPTFLFGPEHDGNVTTHHYPATGYLTAFLGACCGAAVYILIRSAGKAGVHVLQLLFSWCFFGLLYSAAIGMLLPWAFGIGNSFVLPASGVAWLYILGVCVFGSLGHFFMNYAARHAPAGLASIVRSSGILWSYLLEVLVFHQVPQRVTLAGVALVVIALVAIAIEKQHAVHQEKEKQLREDEANRLELQPNAYGSIGDDDDTEKATLL
mmetsp:Transcript_40178/g.61774  ORF Transcript_40178/g.61774 Transcript_40178/m.61774 type:complete len:378 (-) Transcript_40178:716-1849(-)